ncbi:MAG: hypothetical protein V1806_05040 [Pseudomonadota bacterium]
MKKAFGLLVVATAALCLLASGAWAATAQRDGAVGQATPARQAAGTNSTPTGLGVRAQPGQNRPANLGAQGRGGSVGQAAGRATGTAAGSEATHRQGR